jgi:hypothetical protein
MKILPCKQLSAAWFQYHAGTVSGSWMRSVLDRTKSGASGAKRQTYFRMKLAELLTGIAVQDHYVSKDMLDGIEREPAARRAYELEEDTLVEQIGFALHDNIPRFGGSFDGLVGDDGLLEIKCPRAGTHAQWVLDGVVPKDHVPQIDAYLAVSGRAWCDFVSYCPFVPKELRLMVIRRERDQKAIEALEYQVVEFNAEVDRALAKLRERVGNFDLPAAMAAVAQEPERADVSDLEQSAMLSNEDLTWAAENL